MFGYHGQFWRIALPEARIEPVPLADDVLRSVVGGAGLAAWLLARDCPAGIAPADPACPLVLAWGPLAGLDLPGADRFCVATKSPLTERLNDALCASAFGAVGRGLGADALWIAGACPELSVLHLAPGRAELCPWPALAGLSAAETEAAVRERWGEAVAVAAIGPAGERGVPFATLSAAGRHAGRGGTGAVLGAKRLKAIAIEPGTPPAVAEPTALAEWRETLAGRERESKASRNTLRHLEPYAAQGVLPARNFGAGAGGGLGERMGAGDSGGKGGRLEYESVSSLGPLCGLEDAATIREAVARCDALGLDTISAGVTLGFAMDCAERGIPLPEPLMALRLRFGNGEAVLVALEAIGTGAGPHAEAGALLALGTRRLAARLGPSAEALAPHVKGLELPAYDPRRVPTLALALAVGARGADHNKSSAYDADLGGEAAGDPEGMAGAVVAAEDRAALLDSLILSKFLRRAVDAETEIPSLLGVVTGHTPDAAGLRAVGAAIADARKRFNQRQGWQPVEDTLPGRFFAEPGPSAPALDPERFKAAVAAYYRLRGWDGGQVADDATAG